MIIFGVLVFKFLGLSSLRFQDIPHLRLLRIKTILIVCLASGSSFSRVLICFRVGLRFRRSRSSFSSGSSVLVFGDFVFDTFWGDVDRD